MAKEKKSKKPKLDRFAFYGFNITLQSNERSGDDAYLDLFTKAFRSRQRISIGSDRAMLMRTQFSTEINFRRKTYKILTGRLVRFNIMGSQDWYDEIENSLHPYEIPVHLFPNGYECDYVFIPSAHRLFFKVGPISVTNVYKFLVGALKSRQTEQVTVSLMQSRDTFEEIFNSSELLRLNVKLTYTNHDIGDDAKELMDKLYKDANAGKAETTLTPDQNGTLKQDSDLVKGLLELAEENGQAIARIVDNEGKKKTIRTIQHPEKRYVSVAQGENPYIQIFEDVMNEKRPE